MAIVFDASSSGIQDYGNSITSSHTVGAGNNRLLLVAVSRGFGNVTGITYGGVALTQLRYDTTNGASASIWYLIAPVTGTANIVATCNNIVAAVMSAASFSGCDQTTPITTSVLGAYAAAPANESVNITVPTNGIAFDVWATSSDPVSLVPNTGQTLILAAKNTSTAWLSTSYKAAATTMGWTNGNPGYGVIHTALAIAPAVGPATVPDAPTIGAATVTGATSASVNGTAPANNGGAAITSYTATSTPGGITGTSATLPVPVTGLTTGTAYTFTLHATNSVGNSAESAASNSMTPAAGNQPPAFGGTIPTINGTNGTAITAVDVHSYFTDTDALTYSASPAGTAWPAGVTINASTGVISGTPSATATTSGCKVRATDTAAQTVDSNAFSFVVAAPSGGTVTFAASGACKNLNGSLLPDGSYSVMIRSKAPATGSTVAVKTTLAMVSGVIPSFVIAGPVAGTEYIFEVVSEADNNIRGLSRATPT